MSAHDPANQEGAITALELTNGARAVLVRINPTPCYEGLEYEQRVYGDDGVVAVFTGLPPDDRARLGPWVR